MSNLTMTIQIEAPDLVAALTQLAAAIHPSAQTLNIPQPQVPAPAAPVPVAVAAPAPVPVTPQPPAYTLDQLAKAGAALVDAGKMESLMALLAKYGVQAVTQLPPAQYGAFATELRALGAQI